MPIYVYETTDTSKPIRRFEVKQSMKDEPLRVDPKTGEPFGASFPAATAFTFLGDRWASVGCWFARIGLRLLLLFPSRRRRETQSG